MGRRTTQTFSPCSLQADLTGAGRLVAFASPVATKTVPDGTVLAATRIVVLAALAASAALARAARLGHGHRDNHEQNKQTES
ncbi:MAG: hypothetical protein JWP06_228 [Candidatus Saccharibacteria bacterium]|nr:hypothetical protein [Candidatus Saccharibacteria bacterium]